MAQHNCWVNTKQSRIGNVLTCKAIEMVDISSKFSFETGRQLIQLPRYCQEPLTISERHTFSSNLSVSEILGIDSQASALDVGIKDKNKTAAGKDYGNVLTEQTPSGINHSITCIVSDGITTYIIS